MSRYGMKTKNDVRKLSGMKEGAAHEVANEGNEK